MIWYDPEKKQPGEFVSVLGCMKDPGPFPAVRECFLTDEGEFFFPALGVSHPVRLWADMPQPEDEEPQEVRVWRWFEKVEVDNHGKLNVKSEYYTREGEGNYLLHYETADKNCYKFILEAAGMTADGMAAYISTAPIWLPVSEPPLVDDEYIVCIKGAAKPTTLYYDPTLKLWYDTENEYKVTHWMPLPEMPKEEI